MSRIPNDPLPTWEPGQSAPWNLVPPDPNALLSSRPPLQPERDDGRGRRWVLAAIVLALVVLAVVVIASLQSDDRTATVDTTLPAVTTAPVATTAPPTTAAPTTATPTTLAPTTAGPTTVVATTSAPTTAPAPTTAAPATTARPATTVPVTTILITTAPPPPATLPDGTDEALAVAQRLAAALAADDWSTARQLEPTSALDDAAYEQQFGRTQGASTFVVRAALVDARHDLRLVLVNHDQDADGTQRTRVVCARWIVDTAASTVERVSQRQIAALTGWQDPTSVAQRTASQCR